MLKIAVVLAVFSAALGAPPTRSVPTLDGRIVGGQDADIADYSYQLSLLFIGSHICGAATIAPTWALTAAHCTEGIAVASLLTVRAGSSTRNSGGQVVSILEVTANPNYTRATMDYDISVLQLSSAIDAYSQPIALPSAGTGPAVGSTLVVTGWGATAESGSASTTLQVVQVPVISQESCSAAYSNYLNVTDRMVCAGLLGQGGKDACQGDSGGPAVVNKVLYGLVSWGEGCARANYPGVYTNIAALRPWITTITGL